MNKIVSVILIIALSVNALEIKLAQSSSKASSREIFWRDVIEFVLTHSEVPYSISVTYPMTQARVIAEIKSNSGRINLHVMGTSAKLESDLLPVRIPITRGLIGYRLFIIHKEKQTLYDSINSLENLQPLLGIQGLGWSDVELLEYSGLRQKEMPYDDIFRVIDFGRGDYFSRSIHEAYEEVKERKEEFPNLAVEKKVLLVYPFALFVFSNRENVELVKVIEECFIKAYDDGVFTDFFYNHPHIKDALHEAKINERTIINIPNPFITEETMAIPAKYWHRL